MLLPLLWRRADAAQPQLSSGIMVSMSTLSSIAEPFLVGALLLGITLTSHAAAARLPLPMLADWLHLVSAAVWVGGLLYLAVVLGPLLRRLDDAPRAALLGPLVQRFSNLALTSVVVLIVTGLYAAWVNIPSAQAIVSTWYGRTLSVKLGILVPLLGIAAVNLLVMRPRLVDAARKRLAELRAAILQQRFLRLVRAEVVLATVVLLVASVLALLPTARQATALGPKQEIVLVRRSDGGVEGVLRITPYHVGENTFELKLRNLESDLSIPDARARFTFLPLAAELGTTVGEAAPQADGRYVLRGMYLGSRGPWLITVTVRRRGREAVTLMYPVEPDWARGTPMTPDSNPRAAELLGRATDAMNRLRSLRQRQEITDGAGNGVVTLFELAAPNAMHYRVIDGAEVIVIGNRQFFKERASWLRQQIPFEFKFPNFAFANSASNVVFGPREVVDGRQTQVVTFVLNLAGSRARYAVWVDEQRHRIVREFMVAPSHYMTIRNYDFNAPMRIEIPSTQ
ncbi:MAG: copper resistance D family protein [bacterium]